LITEAALSELRRRADAYLDVEPPSVVRKRVLPPSGDIHDYLSLAPYFWRNPDTDDGLPYVMADGEFNPAAMEIPDKPGLYLLLDLVYVLGHAYRRFRRPEHAEKAATCLRIWFLAPETRMNPNLEYGQGIPGVSHGRPVGLIDTREIGKVLEGAMLLEGSGAWSAADTGLLRTWIGHFLTWLFNSAFGREEASATNNHATWYQAQAAAMLLFCGHLDRAREMVERGNRLLDEQVAADGRQPQELTRTNSRHYSMFNLLGFCRLARVGDQVGADLWEHRTPSGAGMGAAIDHLLAYWDAWPLPTLGPMPADNVEFLEVLYGAAQHCGARFAVAWRERSAADDLSPIFFGPLNEGARRQP
jgi:hypothetical protein